MSRDNGLGLGITAPRKPVTRERLNSDSLSGVSDEVFEAQLRAAWARIAESGAIPAVGQVVEQPTSTDPV